MSSNGPAQPPQGAILHSWKEIAAHFDVSIRTVQNWEQEYGLPVQRLPGLRGRVWARVEELEAWRNRCEDSGTIEFPMPRSAEVSLPAPPEERRGAKWWVLAAVVVLGAVSLAGLYRLRNPVQQISDCRLEGDTLVALDKQGKPLWRHVFPMRVQTIENLKKSFSNLAQLVEDLNGDGTPELVFPVHEFSGSNTDELICFDGTGRILWRYTPVFELRNARGEVFAGPWKIRTVRALPLPGGGHDVLAVVDHLSMFPGMLVRLDGSGKPIQTYTHAGHLGDVRVAPKGPDGRPVVYVVANANSWRAVDIVALDPDRMSGYSQEPEGDAEHALVGEPVAPERARVLIPPTAVSQIQYLSNTTGSLFIESGQLVSEIVETIDFAPLGLLASPDYFHVFNLKLEHQHARISDSLELAVSRLQDQGKMPGTTARAEVDRVTRSIRTLVAWH